MDLTPSQVSGATFRTVRKGYDPDEVDSFLAQAAKAIETAQQQATAMEARARAAVARLQEVSAQQADATAAPEPSAPPDSTTVAAEETISRTLLLAQRTADTTIAEARDEAERIRADAQQEAESTLDSTREMSARLIDEARSEARQLSESERRAAENEVEELKARRDFLVGDVDQLEQFLVDQRERLRGAARQIEALCERVPSGLGDVRRPPLSAADEEPADDERGDDERADDASAEDDGDGTEAIDMSAEMADAAGSETTDAEFLRLAVLASEADDDWNEPRDETAELIVPSEVAADYATIDELVEAIDDGDTTVFGEAAASDAAEQAPNVDPSDAPDLPKRNPPSD